MILKPNPNNQAFVLSEDKVESFLKQDNSHFKKAIERFEKIKRKKKSDL